MKKIILLFFALFFLGCKTTTITKPSNENTQVSAGKIIVRTEALRKNFLHFSNEIKSIQKIIPELDSALDGMKSIYAQTVAERDFYKQKSEIYEQAYKELLKNILDENPEEKAKLSPEVYKIIYEGEI